MPTERRVVVAGRITKRGGKIVSTVVTGELPHRVLAHVWGRAPMPPGWEKVSDIA